jgi:integral membrane sensor domain MASE1
MTFLPRVRSHFKTASRQSAEDQAVDILLNTFLPLTLVLFVVSLASIGLTRNPNATLWPSNAILLAFLLRSRRDSTSCGLIFLSGGTAIALANLAGGYGPALSALLAAGNIVEVATAWVLLAIYQDDDSDLTRIQNLAVFMMLAGGVAPLVSASIGGTALAVAHAMPWMPAWSNWYASNAIGMITVAPFLLSLKSKEWQALRNGKRYREALGVLALVVLVATVASFYRPFLFVVAPALLFATFRFGVLGAAAGTLILALVASVFIAKGIGPLFVQADLSERIFAMQIILAGVALWSLPVAAVLAERDGLLADLSGELAAGHGRGKEVSDGRRSAAPAREHGRKGAPAAVA